MSRRDGEVVIVGVGLIGGSIGLAIRGRKLARRVVGVGRDLGRLDEAIRLGAIDEATIDLAQAAREADVVVVCTPVDRLAGDVLVAARAAGAATLITDAGSTKRAIVQAVEADPEGLARFVGAHPIAGSERQGVANARADLFEGRTCALTPTGRTPPETLARARSFWESIGCRVIEVDPETHDRQLARTSHLPHAIAAALASVVGPDLVAMAAGAYRDGTRVAGAEATIWAPIFLENRAAVLGALDDFGASLSAFRDALEAGDETAIRGWWGLARENRRAFDAQNRPGGVASGGPGE